MRLHRVYNCRALLHRTRGGRISKESYNRSKRDVAKETCTAHVPLAFRVSNECVSVTVISAFKIKKNRVSVTAISACLYYFVSVLLIVLLLENSCLLPQAEVMKGDFEPGWLYKTAPHHQGHVALGLDGVETNKPSCCGA